MTSLIHSRVDAALRALISDLDYDLHKSIERDEETGEDGYPDLVDEFVEAYAAEDATTPRTVEVTVKLPDLTQRLLNTVKAVMNAPEEWTNGATVRVSTLAAAIAGALLPDWEHNEDICSTGLVCCNECAAAQ